MENKAVAITGRRPSSLPWGEDEFDERAVSLKNRLKYTLSSIIEKGYKTFYVGMAEGVDTYIAEILVEFKMLLGYEIEVIAVIPYKHFEERRKRRSQERYRNILGAIDDIIYTGEEYTSTALFIRNKYMVDNANLVLAVYDNVKNGGTYNTLKYARSIGKDIIIEEI